MKKTILRIRPETVSAVATLAVLVVAAAIVAALPELVTIPNAFAIGARGLGAACLAIAYAAGVAMQPWLLPRRNVR